jgi:hypothetical protein
MSAAVANTQPMEATFKKGGILDDTKHLLKTVPPKQMQISFSGTSVKPGEQLKVSNASTHPSSPSWEGLDDEAMYMVMMVDLDAPARGKDKNKNYLHWLAVNMPGDEIARSNLVQKYTPPNPPKVSPSVHDVAYCESTTQHTERGSNAHVVDHLTYTGLWQTPLCHPLLQTRW